MKIRESCLQTGNFIYKPGISLTKQDFHLQRGSLGLQRGFSGYYLPKVYKFKHNVIQCQTKEGYLYILSNDSIYKYKFDGEKMHLEASSKISFKGSWKDGYISSFFLR